MLKVNKYTPRDRRIDVGLVVGGGLLAGWLLYRTSTDRAAARFGNLWELQDPGAMQRAAGSGLVYPSEVQHVIDTGAVPSINAAIDRLLDAPADWSHWDEEAQAVGAVMRATYPETLLFASMFQQRVGVAPGVFMLQFMDPEGWFGDQQLLAAVVRHVERQRGVASATHGR